MTAHTRSYSTHAYFLPRSAVVVAAVHCDDTQSPDSVALSLGLSLEGLIRRGGVQIQGSPRSPQAEYWYAVGAARAAAVADLGQPNEAWTMADRRWLDKESTRLADAAKQAVPLPTEPEPTWAWRAGIGFVFPQAGSSSAE
jgi:hypothetical protein